MKPSVALFTTVLGLVLFEQSLAGRDRANRCKYVKEGTTWTECDTTTNTVSRTLTLKPGSPETCEATKTLTKPCQACKYDKAQWGECDPSTNTKTRTLTLKRGDDTRCERTKTDTKPCGRGGDKEDKNGCTYGPPVAGACENGSRTITKTLTAGDAGVCEQTKSKTKPCNAREGRKGKRGNKKAKKNRRANQDNNNE